MKKPTPNDIEQKITSIDLIVSKSDIEGKITYINPIFMKISGYTQGELIEQPHSILRHPDMPKAIFKYFWKNLKEGHDVVAYVKNLCKDGSFYWVLATVKMAKNPDGSFRNYMSTRKSITEVAKEKISKIYSQLLETEKMESLESSEEQFEKFLLSNNIHDIKEFNALMQKINN
jgi:PAS domain S-box-containing protein